MLRDEHTINSSKYDGDREMFGELGIENWMKNDIKKDTKNGMKNDIKKDTKNGMKNEIKNKVKCQKGD